MEWVSQFDTEDRAQRSTARVYPCEGNPRLMREDGDTYREYWGRVDVGDHLGTVVESESSLRVEIGPCAIALNRVGSRVVGTLYTFDGAEWSEQLSVG